MSFHANGLMIEARRAYELGDVERAKRICSMILQLQPRSPESEEAAAFLGLPQRREAPADARSQVSANV
jgi:hypothetical protein